MGKYISIGLFNKYYYFILGSITVKFLITFSIGLRPVLTPNKPFFLFGFKPVLLKHPIIRKILEYFGIGLGGIILDYIFNKKNKYQETTQDLNMFHINTGTNELLAKDNILLKNKKKYKKKVFFIFFSYFYSNIIISSFDSLGFHQLKIWTLEILAFIYFSQTILGKKKIYKHQKLSFTFILIFSTLLFLINSFIPNTNNEDCLLLTNKDEREICILLSKNVYEDVIDKLSWYFIPIIMIIYLSAITSDAYACVRNKWFMDIKYITIFKMLSYIGIVGFVFSLICLFIISYIPCNSKSIINSICQLTYNDLLYYDNFRILRNINVDNNFFIEIFVILTIFIILNFLRAYFNLLIINYLGPFYLMPIDMVYYIIYHTVEFLLTISQTNPLNITRLIIANLADIIGVICFCVYLEIIELHFFNLDKNIKKNIMLRAEVDLDKEILEENEENSDYYICDGSYLY